MILLQVNQLTKYYGANLILSNISLEIKDNARIGVVGRNGAGKTTLLKILAGKLPYESGEIIKPKNVSIGYMDQHTGLNSDRTIWDEMMTVFDDLRRTERRLRDLEKEMTIRSSDSSISGLVAEYDRLQIDFQDRGGYQYEADTRSVLHGLGFSEKDYHAKISTLSGGQKTRLALGKLLLSKPDLLLLDEPTNHLDIETLSWLEQYLLSYKGAIVVISHDRYFLDKVVTEIFECEDHKLTRYAGNYSRYLQLKAEMYEQNLKRYEAQQEEIARMKAFIAKNLARASTTKQAQSRRKMLERMELIEKPRLSGKSVSFSFQIERPSGNEVLKLKDLSIGYGGKPLCTGIRLRITRGESVALLGPNGIGKSTLLKTIVGQLTPLSGNIIFGAHVSLAYYDQEQENLHSNKTVLEELWDVDRKLVEKEVRTLLGNFLFSGEDVLKPVSALSGGERARLALAKLMLKKVNFLILDEPTNHLDLDSKAVLENALIDYPGTILFVSHDRFFINRLATKVIELSGNGLTEYLGNYDYYVEKKKELEETGREAEGQKSKKTIIDEGNYQYELAKEARKEERRRLRRMKEIEREIEELESIIEQMEGELAKEEVYTDYEKANELNRNIHEMKQKIEKLFEEWESLEV